MSTGHDESIVFTFEDAQKDVADASSATKPSPQPVGLPPLGAQLKVTTGMDGGSSSTEGIGELDFLMERLLDEQEKTASLRLQVTTLQQQIQTLRLSALNQMSNLTVAQLESLRGKLAEDAAAVDELLLKARLRGDDSNVKNSWSDNSSQDVLRNAVRSLKQIVVDLSSVAGIEVSYRICRKCQGDPASFHAALRTVRGLTEGWTLVPGAANRLRAEDIVASQTERRPEWQAELAEAVLECVISFEMHTERVLKLQRPEAEELAQHERGLAALLDSRLATPRIYDLYGGSSQRMRSESLATSNAPRGASVRSLSPAAYIAPSVNRLQFVRPTTTRGLSPSVSDRSAIRPSRGDVVAALQPPVPGSSSAARPSPHRISSVSPCRVPATAAATRPAQYGTGVYSHATVSVPAQKATSELVRLTNVQSAPGLQLRQQAKSAHSPSKNEVEDDWDGFVESEVNNRRGKFDERPVVAPKYSDPADPINQHAPATGALRPHRSARKPQETHTLRVTFN